jgi:hypothetical protein
MFATYKKIISPESSPVLGPASPNLALTNANVNNANVNNANAINEMKPLSLYTCCCSSRNDKTKKDSTIVVEKNDRDNKEQEETKPKYEFGHATHYTHSVTSPRLLCEFETGTPPSP